MSLQPKIEPWHELLDSVMDGKNKSVSLPMIPVSKIVNYLHKNYSLENYDTESNGWQVDFWVKLQHSTKDTIYMIAGSLFYGGFSFSIYTDEEED